MKINRSEFCGLIKNQLSDTRPFVTIGLTNDFSIRYSIEIDEETGEKVLVSKNVRDELSGTNFGPYESKSAVLYKKLDLQPLTVVMGDSRSGKTTLMRNLMSIHADDGLNPVWLNYLELEVEEMITSKRVLADRLVQNLMDPNVHVIYVDSFRSIVYASGGAAASGGIDKNIFSPLTALGGLAEKLGKHIVVSINLMSKNANLVDQYFDDLTGSVSTTIRAEKQRYSIYNRADHSTFENVNFNNISSVANNSAKQPARLVISRSAL